MCENLIRLLETVISVDSTYFILMLSFIERDCCQISFLILREFERMN